MAIVTGGPELNYRGRVGDRVYYVLNGQVVCRTIGVKPNKNPTQAELAARQVTSMYADFHHAAQDFLRVGYNLTSLAENSNYHNECRKYFQAAVAGSYPDRRIEYKDLLVTHGEIPMVEDAAVVLRETGLEFSWKPDSHTRGMHYTDQVMMLAYFPELKKSRYITAGAQRHYGKATLELHGIPYGQTAEIFISFIEDNHKSISNSQYLGQFTW